MIRLIEEKKGTHQPIVKQMKDMQPLEICVVTEDGAIVMRTASEDTFEVIDLSESVPNGCWLGTPTIRVRELFPSEKYILELS